MALYDINGPFVSTVRLLTLRIGVGQFGSLNSRIVLLLLCNDPCLATIIRSDNLLYLRHVE